ncbi:MAG TPA: hypothetical protein VEA40_12485 [Ramlibacter sp.]|nr:hypothetical protein [Ramlibacter sp.]
MDDDYLHLPPSRARLNAPKIPADEARQLAARRLDRQERPLETPGYVKTLQSDAPPGLIPDDVWQAMRWLLVGSGGKWPPAG